METNPFDTSLNADVHRNVFDATTDVVSNLIGGATATVVDIGASIWNSLPGTQEVDTADLIAQVSTDALRVYEKNPETIQAASFIGGMFIPMSIANKGMQALRAGTKGMSWFTGAGREVDLIRARNMWANAEASTAEYKQLIRGIYAKTAVNQAIDAVAMEAALYAGFNAHPWMEDYQKDLATNFTQSALLGGVIGSGAGVIADRFLLKQIGGDAFNQAWAVSTEGMKTLKADMPSAVMLQSAEANIKNLDNIITARKDLGKTETNDLAYNIAAALQLQWKADQVRIFDEMISPEIRNLATEEKDVIMRTMIQKPEVFGTEKVRLLTEKELTTENLVKPPKAGLGTKPQLQQTNASPMGPVKPVPLKEAVYFPEVNLYGIKSDAIHYAGAVSLGLTKEELAKKFAGHNSWGKVPNIDAPLELLSKSAAHAEAEYIAAFHKVVDMTPTQLRKMHISEMDGPMLTALIYRLRTDPAVANISIKTSDRSPVYKKIISEHEEKIVSSGVTPVVGGNGSAVAKVQHGDYAKFLDTIGVEITQNKYRPSGVSSEADNLLRRWVGAGGMAKLRRAATDWLSSKSRFAKSGVDSDSVKLFEEFYNSAGSQAVRAKFRTMADADGYVLLYRGVNKDDILSHSSVESYTTHIVKAQEFIGAHRSAGVKLHRVHVDEIIMAFEDSAGGTSPLHNSEILVLAPKRHVEAALSGEGKVAMQKAQKAAVAGELTTTTKKTLTEEIVAQDQGKGSTLAELEQMLIAQKQEALDSLAAAGLPIDSIAIKTNTNKSVVSAYLLGKGNGATLTQFADEYDVLGIGNIKNLDDIDRKLRPQNIPLVLQANAKKNPLYVENHIALDNRSLRLINKNFTFASMLAAKSQGVGELSDLFYSPTGFGIALDAIEARLGKVNNSFAGNAFFQSLDSFAKEMGDVGPAISAIGKGIEKVRNNIIARVVEPISAAMTSVQKDVAALTEFNIFFNVNASLKSWRGLDDEGFLVQKAMKPDAEGKMVEVLERVRYDRASGSIVKEGGEEYGIKIPAVLNLVRQMQEHATELKELADTARRIKGAPPVNDIGLWIPAFNPVGKFIAYVHDQVSDTTKLLWANSEKELDNLTRKYQADIDRKGLGHQLKLVKNKDEQEKWNKLNGRMDPITMEIADVAMQKGGASASAIVKPDFTLLGELAKGYEHYITAQVRNLADLNMSEVTEGLQKLSEYNMRFFKNQPLTDVQKMINKPKDAAAIMRNTLIGNSNLGEYAGWKTVSKGFDSTLGFAAGAVTRIWNDTITPLTRGLLKRKNPEEVVSKVDWEEFVGKLDAAGIVHPYAAWDASAAQRYGLFNIQNHPDTSKRLIYASNALAATLALRFGELAQPLVNAMSMPIMTGMAIAQKMPDSFMGVQKNTAKFYPVQIMYEGVRAMFSPHFKDLNKKWAELGYFAPMVSEANGVMKATRQFDKGAIAKVEAAVDSQFVQLMSKPSDYTEALTRTIAMNTGAVLAKRLYPDLHETGITIFARDFMDKSIGNFHSSQRPVMFQGTLGVALGLFQTYMLTFAQNMYGHLQMRNYKAIGKAMLTQSTIFGTQSMPGYDFISQMIGDKFSDDNFDLTTGTYRAFGDVADFILYGLPSNAGMGTFSTRGDVDPRMPNFVAASFIKQGYDVLAQMKHAMGSPLEEMPRAFGQALSMQSMSRPIARGAEIFTQTSVTRQGNTVQVPEEVWTMQGILARVMATRPLEEQKLRDADHLNHLYGSLDRENRQEAMERLKTSIRNGTLDEEDISTTAEKYFRHGGSPSGWRSAVNEAIGRTNVAGQDTFISKLKPDSPLNHMINNLD